MSKKYKTNDIDKVYDFLKSFAKELDYSSKGLKARFKDNEGQIVDIYKNGTVYLPNEKSEDLIQEIEFVIDQKPKTYKKTKKDKNNQKVIDKTMLKDYAAYIDGSFKNGMSSYSFLILKDGKIIEEQTEKLPVGHFNKHRNVYGEIMGIIKLVEWFEKNDIKDFKIGFDYSGLEKWAKGEWKANNELTKFYSEFMKKKDLNITWLKIPSHSNVDIYNDRVDQNAKSIINMN
ncbi:MAG: hypothetical protein ACQESN_08055 [Thermotogota bacterium]